jgi:uncharacterized membrane protein (UPF0136 family)
VKKLLPSKDTARKFFRGLLFAAIAAACGFFLEHGADLGLESWMYASLVPVVAFIFRYVTRDAGKG